MKVLTIAALVLLLALAAQACTTKLHAAPAKGPGYEWTRVVEKANFPESYNYPVFVSGGKMAALNRGAWISTDGKDWTKTSLPDSGLNSAYQKYVQFNGAICALGTMTGNYEDLHLTTKIARTTDFQKWETLADRSNLPERVFYGAAVFDGKIWLVGGYDGKQYYNDVWTSSDAVHWDRVTEHAAWSPRNTRVVVFKNKLWLLGGGVIDGQKDHNPNSETEMWSSADGIAWKRAETNATGKWAGTPVVYDDKLWLIGANRNDGNFSNSLWVSGDGINWEKRSAPWSPRGGVAVWEFGGKLFMTGGKYSETENGEIKFIYSNDVWVMAKHEG